MEQKYIDIELAKSYFVLAQLFIILSGFFFTISGITMSLSVQNHNSASQEASKALDTIPQIVGTWNQLNSKDKSSLETWINMTINFHLENEKAYTKTGETFDDMVKKNLILGGILAGASLFFWNKGKNELKKL